MALLAIESTASLAGVTLVDAGQVVGTVRIAHRHNLSGNLLYATEWLLNRHGLEREALRAIAVNVGPGSFTGLKIGVVIAKMWAHVWAIDLVGVSAFEACAVEMPEGIATLVALPARKDALYMQWLRSQVVPEPLSPPAMVLHHALSEWLQQSCPDVPEYGAIGVAQARSWIEPLLPNLHWRTIESPSPEGVARVGWQRWQAKEVVAPFQLVPFYLQPPSITPNRRARTH